MINSFSNNGEVVCRRANPAKLIGSVTLLTMASRAPLAIDDAVKQWLWRSLPLRRLALNLFLI